MKKILYITLLCAALLSAPFAHAQEDDRDERRRSIIEQIFPFLQNNSTSTQDRDNTETDTWSDLDPATSTPIEPPAEEPATPPQTPPSNPPAQTPSEAPVTSSIPTPTPTTTTPLTSYTSASTTPPIAGAVSSTPTLGAGGIYSTAGLSSDTTRLLLALSLAMGIGGFLLAQPRRGRMQELFVQTPHRVTSA